MAIATDSIEAAKEGGLRYFADTKPGISRHGRPGNFHYVDDDDRRVSNPEDLARITSLAIPPAWTDVWISPITNGHLQATGRDARGRKQYRYHAKWSVRDASKFDRVLDFAKSLPRIRTAVDKDLTRRGLPREKILATIVRLLETTHIRVGSEEYARSNRSFGLTTMRNRHVGANGSTVEFFFEGKSGKRHRIDLRDRKLASIVRKCLDVPGYELFQYLGEGGERRSIGSADVNEYVRQISGEDFTATDWCYIHSAVLDAYLAGTTAKGEKGVLRVLAR